MQLPVTVGTDVQMRDTRVVKGVICRDGTYDDFVAKEISGTYGWMTVEGRRVLDIGGNIGAYARWALDNGAAHVRSIEPEVSNFICLQHNTVPDGGRRPKSHQTSGVAESTQSANGQMMVASRALVAEEAGVGEIWLSPTGKNPGNTSSVRYRGRTSQGEIPQLSFRSLLDEERPDVLKIDVEGAEYGFFREALPDCVRQVTIELHLTRPEWRNMEAPRIISLFEGWECHREPRLVGGHWQTIGAWSR